MVCKMTSHSSQPSLTDKASMKRTQLLRSIPRDTGYTHWRRDPSKIQRRKVCKWTSQFPILFLMGTQCKMISMLDTSQECKTVWMRYRDLSADQLVVLLVDQFVA
jgi:hypothetical protein